MNSVDAIVFWTVPILATGLGIYWGRKVSAIALGASTLVVGATAVAAHQMLSNLGVHGWQTPDDSPWRTITSVGMAALFAALSLIGPTIFERRLIAAGVSLAIVLAFVMTGIPLLISACVLFGACI